MSDQYSNTAYQRPRSRTMLSFGSNRSGGAAPKFTKEELIESPSEKAAKRMSTKANPNVAMHEVEPVTQALMQPTMNSNLRGMQHRDMYGNVIVDPDRSNPTRSRMERPLDTIRAFEAAIDGKYGRMSALTETPGPSRPVSAYFGGMDNPASRRKSSFGPSTPNHGNRSGRPDSYVDSAMYGSANRRRSPAPFGAPQRRGFGPGNRNNSDPVMYGNGMYSQPKKEPYPVSYDSAGSSGGSGGTENWNPSTDPSSPNSSVDRFQPQPPPPPKHDLGEQYGFSGFGGVPQTNLEYNYQPQQNGYPNQPPNQTTINSYVQEDGPPPPPPHKGYGQSFPSNQQSRGPLPRTPSYSQSPQPQRSDTGDKRKSWLMRRFSKNN